MQGLFTRDNVVMTRVFGNHSRQSKIEETQQDTANEKESFEFLSFPTHSSSSCRQATASQQASRPLEMTFCYPNLVFMTCLVQTLVFVRVARQKSGRHKSIRASRDLAYFGVPLCQIMDLHYFGRAIPEYISGFVFQYETKQRVMTPPTKTIPKSFI